MRKTGTSVEVTVNMGPNPWNPGRDDEHAECEVEYTPTLGYHFNVHDLANSAYIPTTRHALSELARAIIKFLDETPQETPHA